jgi:hypothetical protein
LDRLPLLRVGAYKRGDPAWIRLLTEEDDYVEGGKRWVRPEPVGGFSIGAEKEALELVLHHGDFAYVRGARAQFIPSHKATPVILDVSMEPAGGNASVEIRPLDADRLSSVRLNCDWSSMSRKVEIFEKKEFVQRSNVTPQQWLSCQPRLFPKLKPRANDRSAWSSAKGYIQRYLEGGRISLEQVGTVLNRSVEPGTTLEAHYERRATPIASNGLPPNDTDLLERFVAKLLPKLKSQRERDEALRTLGFTSTNNPEFAQYLTTCLTRDSVHASERLVMACGLCVRSSSTIAQFAKILQRRLHTSPEGDNDAMKAFSRMLCYRDEATTDLSIQECLHLTDDLLQAFKFQREARNPNFLFRYSALCITYLLRKRRDNDNYLDPESKLAKDVKAEFRKAQNDIKTRRLIPIGGAIHMPQVLQDMIDYIDRRGPEVLTMDADE